MHRYHRMDEYKIYMVEKSLDRLPYFENYTPTHRLDKKMTETHIPIFYINLLKQKEYYKSIEGQITLESAFGQKIAELMIMENGPKKWVDVGTWNGHGSIRCILESLRIRKNKEGVEVISYEASPFFHQIAKENIDDEFSELKDQYTLVLGRLPSTLPFPVADFIEDKSQHYYLYYEEEKAIFTNAKPLVVPFQPEVVILDGGEYTGYHDWEAIPKNKRQHIFLDDMNITKNSAVHQLLKSFSDWECVIECRGERNGWAYWKRKY